MERGTITYLPELSHESQHLLINFIPWDSQGPVHVEERNGIFFRHFDSYNSNDSGQMYT